MTYHTVKDRNGLLKSVSYTMVWAELKEDNKTDQVVYAVYGSVVGGVTYLLGVFENEHWANEHVQKVVTGKQELGPDGTSIFVSRVT